MLVDLITVRAEHLGPQRHSFSLKDGPDSCNAFREASSPSVAHGRSGVTCKLLEN